MSQRKAKSARREQGAVQAPAPAAKAGSVAWTSPPVVLSVVAVVFAIAVGIVLARGEGSSSSTAVAAGAEGEAAPALEGEDVLTGETISLADFRGKPVVINIWASWCPGCIEEADDLKRFAEVHPEAQVLGIDIQDTKGGASSFYERTRWEHPSIFDPSGGLAARLGLQGLPTTIFLDADHRIVGQIVGEGTFEDFDRAFAQAVPT